MKSVQVLNKPLRNQQKRMLGSEAASVLAGKIAPYTSTRILAGDNLLITVEEDQRINNSTTHKYAKFLKKFLKNDIPGRVCRVKENGW